MDMNNYCNSYFKINMDEVAENYERVLAYINRGRAAEDSEIQNGVNGPCSRDNTGAKAPVGIIPVVKGNCYGYGLVPMAKLYEERCGAKLIAVSALWEGVELRNAGVGCDILITGGIPRHHLKAVAEYDLVPTLFDTGSAELLNGFAAENRRKMKVHLKIETGMNRLGVKPGKDLGELLDSLENMKYLSVDGVFTHFATATMDYDEPFCLRQFGLFKEALAQLEERGIRPEYIHCANSAATAWFRDAYMTHVRVCSSLLGHEAMEDGREPVGVVEPIEIGTYITNVHDLAPGESVGYDRAYITDKPIRVATASIGFADGFFPKWMRGQGPVLVNGRRARFLGCCMDQSFIDVTGIDCGIGDRVVLIGRSGSERITTREMEVFCDNTFEYLYGTIGPRVERIYEYNKKEE